MSRTSSFRAKRFKNTISLEYYQSAFIEACSRGLSDAVEALLLSRKINVDQMNYMGKSAIYLTVSNYISDEKTPGHKKILEYLLQQGADLFSEENIPEPILIKIFREKIGLVEVVLKYIQNPSRRIDRSGVTILHLAVESCSPQCVSTLLARSIHPPINSIFQKVVLDDRLDLIDIVLRYGADPMDIDYLGISALHYAKSGAMVKKLVGLGVPLNHVGHLGQGTPLVYSIKNLADLEVISALIEYGADPKIDDLREPTILNFVENRINSAANIPRYIRIIELLLEQEKNPICQAVNFFYTFRLRKLGKELELMKSQKIGNSAVTYLQLLNSNNRQAARFFRNEELKVAWNSSDFPTFRNALQKKKFQAIELMEFEDVARAFLLEVLPPHLPIDVVNSIINYLSWSELAMLKYQLDTKIL